MSIRRVTFILPFDDSDELDIDFGDYNSDFKDAFDSGEDEELDLEEDIILLKDNDSPSDSDSEPEEGTSFIDIKEYLIMMSLIKPLILSPAKIPEIFILGALFKTRGYYDDEIRI